ncbi:serine acetyltransferase [Desulfopila sp. IMCC35006]|uniref:serine O-acetyltransferase n=1 Tax=Desulfopila sp. IMCC35006 TaxID=2569542 RepID=UPI0010ADA173|nr:serine acetyltransferase [Desulfopila sp. IMCC35006]TKB23959.1 serine acetyltransferase [Desulfopila sp. IMCC35006]
MFENINSDLNRYSRSGNRTYWETFRILCGYPGALATVIYRYNRYVRRNIKNIILRKFFSVIGVFLFKMMEILYGIHIEPEIDIGPGFYIGHFGNIILGGDTKIGKNCNISQEVTVGYAGRGNKWGLPVIGDYVYIGPGAKIFGKIVIGNHVAIGANAVVTKDLPDMAVAVGVPAKIISFQGSRDFIVIHNE